MEAAWLVSPETPRGAYPTYLMLVRLYEQVDEPGGWTIELFQCQHPQRKADRWYDTETDALTALQAVYKLGGVMGNLATVDPSVRYRRVSNRGAVHRVAQ